MADDDAEKPQPEARDAATLLNNLRVAALQEVDNADFL
jgi:hypothetical protein